MKGFDLDVFLKELGIIVNIDSGSKNIDGVGKVAEFFKNRYEKLGWKVKRHNYRSDVGTTLEIRNSDSAKVDVLLLGHMDTVYPNGTAASRPFTVVDGKGYGPGAGDTKSGILLLLYVAQAINNMNLGLNICVVLNGDEEISSKCSNKLITELAKISSCCFCTDGGREGNRFVNKRKGLAKYVINFKGKPAHAGIAPQDGSSAIHEMANWITELVRLNNYEIGTSLNVGVVSGGTVPNVVAANARMEIDTRFELIEEQQKIERELTYLEKNVKTDGVSVDWKVMGSRPPMNPGSETEALMKIVEGAGAKTGYKIGWISTGGGSDANFTAAAGCPSLDGMGPAGGGSHGDNEWFVLNTVEPRLDLMVEILIALSENKKKNGSIIL